MDKDIDALMWDLVYGYITSHPREAAERIANFIRSPERLYLLEHKKESGITPIEMQNKLDKRRKGNGKYTSKQASKKS